MFKANEYELGCSRCFQRRIWEQASDWLNSFGDGGEETEKRVDQLETEKRGDQLETEKREDQLGFASNGLLNPSSFTLYIGL